MLDREYEQIPIGQPPLTMEDIEFKLKTEMFKEYLRRKVIHEKIFNSNKLD